MAKQTINIGASPNDGTGTPLRTAFDYCNLNFTELYTATGPSGNNIVVPGSATITGDLTVDTNVLKVDSTLNKVSVNTTTFATDSVFAVKTPSGKFDVRSYGGTSVKLSSDATMGYNVATGGEHIFQINDSNELTLNALGLGLGASPSLSGGSRRALTVNASTGQLSILELAVNGSIAGYLFSNASQTTLSSQGSTFFSVETNSTERLRIDSAGNCGIGVVPSAWSGAFKAVQLNSQPVFAASGANNLLIASNWYSDGTDKYVATGAASRFVVSPGSFNWQIAPSGTAGNAITFTQAMTLDASGNLLVGTTTAIGKLRVRNGSGQNFVVDVSTANQVSLQNYGSTGDGGFQELNLWGSPVTITTGTAGGTSGTERIRVKSGGQMRFVPLAADPAGAEAGDVYYNSSSNKLKCYNGSTWNDLF